MVETMRWRWDQGRLTYFQYDCILKMAEALVKCEGANLHQKDDVIRPVLEEVTGMPFSPKHYKVWRNYSRVFQCALLATSVDGKLIVTNLCRKLVNSSSNISSDEYLNFVFSRFALPFPAFTEYDAKRAPVFPFLAIIKFVMTHLSGVSLTEVFSYVIGNNCSGTEDLNYYRGLVSTNRQPIDGDENRQVREMLVFLGQASYLKWFDGRLYIDSSDYTTILNSLIPSVRQERSAIPQEEFLRMTSLSNGEQLIKFDVILNDRQGKESFVEGGRTFITHGKTERSPLVRKRFFQLHPETICDACHLDTHNRYPWTENILELHHILPLSATLNMNGTTTTLDDMVPLCPTCHRGVHAFYKVKLTEWGVTDFGSKKMAIDVYNLAKESMKI